MAGVSFLHGSNYFNGKVKVVNISYSTLYV
jgi:hypothetical protein